MSTIVYSMHRLGPVVAKYLCLQCWELNPEPCACQTHAVSLTEPHSSLIAKIVSSDVQSNCLSKGGKGFCPIFVMWVVQDHRPVLPLFSASWLNCSSAIFSTHEF